MVKLETYRFTLGVFPELGKEHQLKKPKVMENLVID